MAGTIARLGTGARYLVLVLAFLLAATAGAWAHAALQAASPAPQSANAEPPDRIELIFNEPVQLLALRIIDANGQDRSPTAAPQMQDGRITWSLPDRLPDGRYLVSWRVTSLDGHVIGGSFTFAVGAAGAGAVPPAIAGEDEHWTALALHALARLTLLFAAGTALFRLLLAPPAIDTALRSATRWLGVAGVIAVILFIGAEGALRAGLPAHALLSPDSWHAALAASNNGWRGCSVIGLLLLAFGGSPIAQWLGLALSLLGMADSGHVLAVLPTGAGHGLMVLHGFTAALWIGAIGPLRLMLARGADGKTADLFRRFQTYGALAMAGALASGIAIAVVLLPRWADLWQSDYGLRLCAKLAAVAVMLIIAALNRLWLTRRAIAGDPGMRRLLRLVLGLDLLAAAMATLLAVGLSLGPPPAAAVEIPVAHARYDVTLAFTPGKVGDNDLAITLVPKAGAPADPKEVDVRLTALGIEPFNAKAERIGAGHYQLQNLPLWIAGPWQVQLGLLIDDFTKLQLSAEVTLTP